MLPQNSLQLLRHATLLLRLGERTLLVDPMLSPREAMEPIVNSSNEQRIPMVDLPLTGEEVQRITQQIDAVLVTHLHRDHWDEAARAMIPEDTLLFCQPEDVTTLKEQSFRRVQPIDHRLTWGNIRIHRTGGRHGTGEIGKEMGAVSGFVFQTTDCTIYLAGDTIWCPEVQHALNVWNPDWTIVNAGGAQFLEGDPITMTDEDIYQVAHTSPTTQIIAVHMDTVNHCHLTRQRLQEAIKSKGIFDRVWIPEDGEIITF